ncbi:MAG: energy transducer TonB [Sphingobacteriaceae bacterium]|jgi:hypothetical protein|nr:energy transducer TonB [Sphingobacteriaceae bacterium]
MTVPDRYGENNYPKAIIISFVIMTALVLLSFWWIVSRPEPIEEVGTGGIIVNYGTSLTGMGDDYMSVEEPSMDPNANGKAPDKVVPNTNPQQNPTSETTDKNIVTQNVEDAPAVTTTAKQTNASPSVSPETKISKPTINPNALYKGNKNNATGQGDGTGSTPGNQGDKDGDPLSNNYGEGGSGNGGVSLSLASRKFVSIPSIQDEGQSQGRIAVEIRVNKSGVVQYARAGAKGTTLANQELWRKCEQAVLGARLNQLESAPDLQIGTVVFNFKVR